LRTLIRIAAASLSVILITGMFAVPAMARPSWPGAAQVTQTPITFPYTWVYNYHSGKCVSVPHSSTSDGIVLWQYSCLNSENFGWRALNGFDGSTQYFIRNENSGKCMAVKNSSAGAWIVQEPCNFANPPYSERFEFLHMGWYHSHDWYAIKSLLDPYCINIYGDSTANEKLLQQWYCPSASNPHYSEWFALVAAGTPMPCPCAIPARLITPATTPRTIP
jgi:Ricin-type beta-trefoil lectin domain-like